MSDAIRLSLWLGSHTTAQILPHLSQAIAALPPESKPSRVMEASVTALDWSQAPLLQERYDPPIEDKDAIETMRQFLHDDCAYALQVGWQLWIYESGKWNQRTWPISVISHGFAFGGSEGSNTWREYGHIAVEFGLDEAFLAELAPWDDQAREHLQANILQLLEYSRRLQADLRPIRRLLWADTEGVEEGASNAGDWTQKLIRRLQQTQ